MKACFWSGINGDRQQRPSGAVREYLRRKERPLISLKDAFSQTHECSGDKALNCGPSEPPVERSSAQQGFPCLLENVARFDFVLDK